jgi:NAD+ diphosphatase
MSFLHRHDPHVAPQASDVCLVIQVDRLLARPETTPTVMLPSYADVASWPALASPPMHLGTIAGRTCWWIDAGATDCTAPAGWQWHDTRALFALLPDEEAHAVNCARQLLWWERRHQFCGTCGTPTVIADDERVRRCPACQAMYFPTASPAVIVAITRGDELLLAHNRNFRPGLFSTLAGFIDPGETVEQAIVREIREEVGIEVGDLRYVSSQPWTFPNSLMLGFRARHISGELVVDGKEIEEARWFRRDALPEIPRHGTIARALIDGWRSGRS